MEIIQNFQVLMTPSVMSYLKIILYSGSISRYNVQYIAGWSSERNEHDHDTEIHMSQPR